MKNIESLIILVISAFLLAGIAIILTRRNSNKSQIQSLFVTLLILLVVWVCSLILQILFQNSTVNPVFFEGLASFGACFVPVTFMLFGIAFSKTKIKFNWFVVLLYIIPVVSTGLMFTNTSHHLMYEHYSLKFRETVFGAYFPIHSIYSYACILIGLIYLIRYIIKNAGFFSKQSLLIFLGVTISVGINVLATFGILDLTVYATPVSFAIAFIFFAFAIFKFDFLKVAPIALQRVVDRMSDGYVIINDNMIITDFNKTFLDLFETKASIIRNSSIVELLKGFDEAEENINLLLDTVAKTNRDNSTINFERYFQDYNKYYNIEISSIKNNDAYLGTLILFKDISQHKQDMNTIRDNQDMLIEKERLASLGQMIGGIAHNLKTPIMSISGATEGLSDLIKEYDTSIEDPEVTYQDHHEIAHDMKVWIEKIKGHLSYMSDIITAIKGQAVSFEDQTSTNFTIDELIRMVDILMKHELKSSLIEMETSVEVSQETVVAGNMNSLVQVINNIISNSIQAYSAQNKINEKIYLTITTNNNSNLLISIKDNAGGLPQKVKEKLFKEMITTKGKNGTGLGLFMSYSNIKAHFGGKLSYETKDGIGTTFFIEIPLINN